MMRLVGLALLIAILAMPACANDWPMFMGNARHSGQAGMTAPSPKAMAALHLVWQARLPTQISASPVVVGNALFVAGEDGNLYKFDLASHRREILYHCEGAISSTPTIADGHLYILSRDGFLIALDAFTGRLLWRVSTGGEPHHAVVGGYGLPKAYGPVPDPWDFYLSSPLVRGGVVYFGSSNGHVYALDAATGERRWDFNAGAPVHATPAYADGRIFVGTLDTRFYALDAKSGRELWAFQGGVDPRYGILVGFAASPTVSGKLVYNGARDGYLYAFDVATGAVRWRYDAKKSWVLTTAAVDKHALYFATSDTGLLVAADKANGSERYRVDTGVWNYASPLLIGDRYVVFGTMTGILDVLDKDNGRRVWTYRTAKGRADRADIVDGKTGKLRGTVLFAPHKQLQAAIEKVKALGAFVASPIWDDGRLIAATADGNLLIFRPGPD